MPVLHLPDFESLFCDGRYAPEYRVPLKDRAYCNLFMNNATWGSTLCQRDDNCSYTEPMTPMYIMWMCQCAGLAVGNGLMLLCILTGDWQKLADLAVAYYNEEEEGEELVSRSFGGAEAAAAGSGPTDSAVDIEGISKGGETNIYGAADASKASRPVSPAINLQPKQPRPKSASPGAAGGGGAVGARGGPGTKHGMRNDGIRAAEPPSEKND